jgi:hypothetical protein
MDLLSSALFVMKFGVIAFIVYILVKDLLLRFFEFRANYPIRTVPTLAKPDDSILPLRLQAYERMVLYSERIAPENLLIRLRPEGLNVAEYKMALMLNIRQEYEHNVTQQIYLSSQLWQIIKLAGEDIIGLISLASEGLEPKADARLLHDVIIDLSTQRGTSGSEKALLAIKAEVAGFMG